MNCLTIDTEHTLPGEPAARIPRRIELLLLLSQAAPDGVPLRELVDASGRSDRNAQASTMNMLQRMRNRSLVEYAARGSRSAGRGRLYKITRAGLEALQLCEQPARSAPGGPAQRVLETGAMRGECPTIVIRSATPSRADLPRQPFWVFGLAQLQAGLGTAPGFS